MLRKLQGAEFCSPAHRKAYLKKQEDLALDFLLQNKKRPKPDRAGSRAPEPERLPSAGEFIRETVRPAAVETVIEQNAEPAGFRANNSLPLTSRLAPLALRPAGFVAISVAAERIGAEARPARDGAIPFAGEGPRIPDAPQRPLWMELANRTPEERPAAGPAPLVPRWARGEAHETRATVAVRPTIRISLREALWPCSPILALAPAARERVEASQPPALVLNRGSSPALSTVTEPLQPQVAARPHASGVSCSRERVLEPRAVKSSPLTDEAAVVPPSSVPPAFAPAPLVPLRASLRYAGLAAAAGPPAARPPAPGRKARDPVVWRCQVQLGPHTKVSPILFEVPEEPGDITPVGGLEPVLKTPLAVRLVQRIRSLPAWSRRLAVLLPLAAMMGAGIRHFSHTEAARIAQERLWSRIRQRAAIEIQDDFRSGLAQWTGPLDWARTWSYDRTGFARPGRLALLAGSLPLIDYRVEFAAEIERRGVGWVFRAADGRNYYASKLVESKRGSFFIVRYAVIDGREQLRMQLPLPVTPSSQTTLHVRQEIRGAQFTTYLDGHIIDTWSEGSLRHGGVGFFADAGESAYIRWVAITQNDDGLGRVCAYLAAAHR